MKIIRFGVDLAKNSFSVCGVDEREQLVLQRTFKRTELLKFFAQRPSAVVAMESGSGAHHWSRELTGLGHDARIIDPRFVAPYRHQGRSGKNDANDAVAICETAGRPGMRFVPVKTAEQQAVLVIHRLRTAVVVEHTRVINQVRGILAEFGVVVPKGPATLKREWAALRCRYAEQVPALAWDELDALYRDITVLHQRVLAYDRKVKAFVRNDPRSQRLASVNGIGPVTASAIVATVGNAHGFRNGRQFAAWLGLTPRQYSTGGRNRLGRISKRGDVYLRTLLVHGARSELMHTPRRTDAKSR